MAADTYNAVDLSRLPAPAVVQALDYETIYADLLAQLQLLAPTFDATIESDPAVKLLQVAAYRELLLRARINEAARSVMVAYAIGADLDNLGALYGVARLVITPAGTDNSGNAVPAVLESDDALRNRIVLAPESYSVAGPTGAYIFHALSADGDVLDASATSPAAGEVRVTVLSRLGDGTASAGLLASVTARVSADDVRPLTDHVTVQSAAIVNFEIAASVTFFAGPDSSVVLAQIQQQLAAYLVKAKKLGFDITRAALFGALYAEGVQNVLLTQPAADIAISSLQAAHCTAVALTNAGVGL
jgi:phage-related baseplate assembly protein